MTSPPQRIVRESLQETSGVLGLTKEGRMVSVGANSPDTVEKKMLLLLSEPCPCSHHWRVLPWGSPAAWLPWWYPRGSFSFTSPSPLWMRGAGSPGDLPGQEGCEVHPYGFENIKTSEVVGSIAGHYSHCSFCTLKPLDTVDPCNQAFIQFSVSASRNGIMPNNLWIEKISN